MTQDYGRRRGWFGQKFGASAFRCGLGLTLVTPIYGAESRTPVGYDSEMGQFSPSMSQDWVTDLLGLFDLICMYLGCPNQAAISRDGETQAWAFVSMVASTGVPSGLTNQERADAIEHIEAALDIIDAFEAEMPSTLVEALVATLMNLRAALEGQEGQAEIGLP